MFLSGWFTDALAAPLVPGFAPSQSARPEHVRDGAAVEALQVDELERAWRVERREQRQATAERDGMDE